MKKLLILLFIGLITITGCSSINVSDKSRMDDNEKFSVEYNVSKNNPFKYARVHDVIDLLNDGTGIVYFADSDDEKSLYYTELILDTLNSNELNEIYYYNPSNIKDNNTKNYKEIVTIIEDYLPEDENSNVYLDIPNLFFVKNGKIIGHTHIDSKYDMDDLLEEKEKKKLIKELKKVIEDYKST